MKKTILYYVLSVCLVSSAFADTTPEILLPNGLKLVALAQQTESAHSHYKIRVETPSLNGSGLASSAQTFNQMMNTTINTAISDFKTTIVENSPYTKNLPESVRENSLFISYQAAVITACNQLLLSVRLNSEIYYAGAVHPTHTIAVFNYNLTTGKELKLEELFQPKSNYLILISNYARADLVNKVKNDNQIEFEKGTQPLAENYLNWNIEANGILIIFNEGQVAPYVFGQPEVLVPYAVLQEDILPSAPIALKT